MSRKPVSLAEARHRPAIRRLLSCLLVVALVGAVLPTVFVESASAEDPFGLQFDGTNDYVTFGAAPGLATYTFTLETWFTWDGGGATTTTGTGGITAYPLVTKGRGEADDHNNKDVNYFLGITSTGKLGADFEEGAAGASPSLNHPVTGSTTVTTGVWHHAAATYDGTTWRLYLDGNLDATLVVGQPPRGDSIQHAGLGTAMTSGGSAAGFFQGTLDEARIWNVARTRAEIVSTINLEVTSDTGLIGRWGMNEGTGTTVADSTGGEDGILANAPTWVTPGAPFDLVVDITAPAAPTGLAATPGVGQVSLAWDVNAETDLAGYNVYRSTGSPVPLGTPINGALVASPAYVDNAVASGTPYYYAVSAVDTSGNESGLSGEDGATPTAPVSFALQFDGSNDYVTFGTAPGLGASAFTLETWVNWTGGGATASTGTGGVTAIPLITKGRGEADDDNRDCNYFFGVTTVAAGGKLVADFEEGATGTDPGLNHPITGSTTVTPNVWHHVAVTYDGTTWSLYLDGVLDGTVVVGELPRSDSIQHAALGSALTSTGGASGYFAGVLEEARIWNFARSQAEIQATMNQAVASGSGLIGRWGLNEGAGTLAGDSTTPGEAGTLTSGPLWVAGLDFGDTTAPAAPTGLAATGGMGQILLAWTANAEADIAGYNIYRSAGSPVPLGTPLNGILITSPAYADTSVVSGTPYYYAVTAVDATGNESGLSAEDDATASTPDALDLGSSGAYVSFGDPAKLDLAQFTIETWFMRTGAGTPSTTGTSGIENAIPLVTHGAPQAEGSNVDANWVLVIDDDTNTIAADFEDMATGLNHPVYGSTVISNDVWYHAAATYDGTTWRLYLNGHLEVTLAVGAAPRSDSAQRSALGTMIETTGDTNGRFEGVLDEARVWNYALSQTEIKSTINRQLTGSETGLVALWDLADGTGTTVADSAGSPANGTITGTGYAWAAGSPFDADITSPVIVAHGNETAEATGPSGAAVTYTAPTATDEDPASPAVTCLPASGSTFALGDTTVNCSATDAHDNVGTSSFTVTVQDTTPPDVATHANVSVSATGPSGAVVNYTSPTATDLVDGAVTVTCVPDSGSTFPIGDTTVTCSATDGHTNTGQSQFTVTVQDEDAPVVAPHDDIVAEATGPLGAIVNYTPPTATDDDPLNPEVSCAPAPGATFPLDSTQVDCSATDNSGNTGHSYFQVTVEDTTDPVVADHADMVADAPGPGGVAVNYTSPTATDLVDGSVPVTCDPPSGSVFPVGDTTVTCSATDTAGNIGQSTFTITVNAPALGAIDLGSGSAYVTFGDPAKLDLGQFTIETWFRRTGAGTSIDQTGTDGIPHAIPLMTHGSPQSDGSNVDANWMLVIADDTDVLGADFEDMAEGQNYPVYGTTPIVNNVWYHAAATYDGSTWRLYLNGNLEASLYVGQAVRSDSIQHSGLGVFLTSTGAASGHFTGVLDETRVWNYARSQAQIAASINSQLTSGAGLVARWGFAEGSGTGVGDSMATPANGTITNSGYSWVAGAPFDLVINTPPDVPTLVEPADGATGVPVPVTLSVEASDPDGGSLGVDFFGRSVSGVGGGDPFTLVVLPDTQFYSESYPATFTAQTQWIVNQRAARNIVFVTHLGDIVNVATTESQWVNADNAISLLDTANVPYGLTPGNHDLTDSPMGTHFNAHFPATRYDSQPWYGGHYGSDNLNSWQTFEGSGMQFLILHLANNATTSVPTAAVLDWAESVVAAHPGYRVILNTHDYLETDGTRDAVGEGIWTGLVEDNCAIDLVLSGHYTGAARATSTNSCGEPVLEVLQDYQGLANGGSGYLRYFEFQPATDEIDVYTYSPTLDSFRTGADQFTLSYDMSGGGSWAKIGATQTVASGATASVSWPGLVGFGYEWYAVVGDGVAETQGPNWSFSITDTPPAAPTGLTADGGPGQVSLDWADNAEPDVEGYNVYRSLVSPVTLGTPLNGVLLVSSAYVDTAVVAGTPYSYAVTAVDGSGNESALSGQATATPTAPPVLHALDMGGGSAYVTFGDPAKLDLGQFTIETWFKRTGEGTIYSTGSSGILNAIPLVTHGASYEDGGVTDINWVLVIDNETDVLGADFEDMASGLNHPVLGVTPIVNNTWYHAAATYDGTTWRLYLNGELERTLAANAAPRSDSTNHSGLGTFLRSTGAAQGHLRGVLDEARVWNYARSQTEIRAAINSQLTSAQTGLVARWGFAEGSGTVVGDSMATPANGTITNSGYSWVGGAPFDLSWDTTAPAAPTGLDATAGAGLVTLEWNDNSEPDLAGYNVYRSLSSPVVKGTPLNGTLLTSPAYDDTAVSGGTEYFYAVTAVDASGNESDLSAEDSATPTGNAFPDVPVLVEPPDGATDVPVPVDLSVVASDSDGGNLDVSFFGRPASGAVGEPFTLVFLPDTQNYSESYPATFTAQTQWVLDNLAAHNIVFVTHTGDIVNVATTESQWVNADAALSLLDGQVPYGLAPGNHDLTDGGARYNAWFPVSRYTGYSWYGGNYGSDNQNSWQTFEGSGMQFLILHLANNASSQPTTAVMNWAAGVIDAHPGYRVILTTHDYLNTDGSRDAMGNTIWNGLVNNNCEIFLVVSGHHYGEDDSTATNSCGDTVHQVIFDTQSDANGGNGWLRFYEFDPAADEINAFSYSPTLGTYDTGSETQFTLAYDMEGEAAFAQIGTTQTVASGATASVVWSDLVGFGYEWYAIVDDGVAQTHGPTWGFSIADVLAPVVADHPDVVVEATGPAGAVVTYTPPTATDDDPPNPTVTCLPASGSPFPIGDTTVSCQATDTAGNTGYNTFTVTVYELGAYGIDLGSGSGYVSFGDPDKLDLSEFTIETWFKRTGAGVSYQTSGGSGGIAEAIPLVTHGASEDDGSNVDANWMLVIDDATDVLAADFEDMAEGLNHAVLGTTPIALNTWYHAAATYDGTAWRLYLNGVLEATLVVGESPRSDSMQPAGLGAFVESDGTPQGHFQGVLDETRVWNYARSPEQIAASVNLQLTAGTGLMSRWGMGEPSGTVVGDSIAPEADGTVIGSGVSRVAGAPFDIVVNMPPNEPTEPSPADGATDVPVPVTLSVTASDPDGGDVNVDFFGRDTTSGGAPFTLVVLPDTQYYSESYPATFLAQTQWVVDEAADRNIAFVTHLGDVVNDAVESQYQAADAAMDLLDGTGIPYGLAVGERDLPDDAYLFGTYFGSSRFAGYPWYGGAEGWRHLGHYETFEASGMQFLVLHISYTPHYEVLDWAEQVIADHPDHRVIVSTHAYQTADGITDTSGNTIWPALVNDNCSIFLVLSGHYPGAAHTTATNSCGGTVHQILQDYEDLPNGGSGYLRYFVFDPGSDQISAYTYSPTLDSYRTGADQFSFGYDMSGGTPWVQIGTTQTVASGAAASVSWPGLGAGSYEWYATVGDGKLTTAGETWGFETEEEEPPTHGFLRVTTSPAVMSQILVNGVPMDTWGLTWVKLAPGDYTVSFTAVPGFTTPAPRVVTVVAGETAETVGQFAERGWLRVITSPAVPSTISVDGVARNDWGAWTDLPAGSYQVCFGAVEGFVTPGCQTAVVSTGLTTITGDFVAGTSDPLPAHGFLRVTTSPAVMSQILVNGIPRDTWGLTWVKLPPGDYTVSFTAVPGFTTPAPRVVTVTEGETVETTGLFVERGWLRVITSPAVPSTISVDGVPRDDWGVWTDLPAGSHEVCFGAVEGFTTPACRPANLTVGGTTTTTGNFG